MVEPLFCDIEARNVASNAQIRADTAVVAARHFFTKPSTSVLFRSAYITRPLTKPHQEDAPPPVPSSSGCSVAYVTAVLPVLFPLSALSHGRKIAEAPSRRRPVRSMLVRELARTTRFSVILAYFDVPILGASLRASRSDCKWDFEPSAKAH